MDAQSYLTVRNWTQFQHYRDRTPPWIKLHYELLTSPDWVMLNDASKLLAVVCMLVASRNEGRIPLNPRYIQKVGQLDAEPDFKPLIECGFLDVGADASALLADAIPRARSREAEAEREKETNKERAPQTPKPMKARTSGTNPLRSLDEFLSDSGGEPPASFGEYASGLGWAPERAGAVWQQFCRYWRSADAKGGGRKRDWLSTWQNWCDRENSRGGGANGSGADRGLASALRSSVASRYGASSPGGSVGRGADASEAETDRSGAPDRLPVGEIAF